MHTWAVTDTNAMTSPVPARPRSDRLTDEPGDMRGTLLLAPRLLGTRAGAAGVDPGTREAL